MIKTSDIRIVYVSCKTMENAQHTSKILITEKLAACCTIMQNVQSFFGWEDSIQNRFECMIIVKTIVSKLDDLEARVLELSLDEVPEILALPVDMGSNEYINWLTNSIG